MHDGGNIMEGAVANINARWDPVFEKRDSDILIRGE